MFKRLKFKSNGYVYECFLGNEKFLRFYGMSIEQFKKPKSKVLCNCLDTSKTYADAKEEIEEEYKWAEGDKSKRRSMLISDNKDIEKSLDCAYNFYKNVSEKALAFINLEVSRYFVDLDTGKGLKLSIESKEDSKTGDSAEDVLLDTVENDEVIDFSKVLNTTISLNWKFRDYCKNRYHSNNSTVLLYILENDKRSIFYTYAGIYGQSKTEVMKIKNYLNKVDSSVVYIPNKSSYFLG